MLPQKSSLVFLLDPSPAFSKQTWCGGTANAALVVKPGKTQVLERAGRRGVGCFYNFLQMQNRSKNMVDIDLSMLPQRNSK